MSKALSVPSSQWSDFNTHLVEIAGRGKLCIERICLHEQLDIKREGAECTNCGQRWAVTAEKAPTIGPFWCSELDYCVNVNLYDEPGRCPECDRRLEEY